MEPIVIALASSRDDLAAYASALAVELDGRGTVYAPVPPVRPEARMAVTVPGDLLVRLVDPGAAAAVHTWARRYLEQAAEARLTLRHGDDEMLITPTNTDAGREWLDRLAHR